MRETGYQKKIIDKIKDSGGWCVNGNYTTDGEADLQCGIPCTIVCPNPDGYEFDYPKKLLLYVAIEVKTEKDYHRVMRAIDEDYNIINKTPLKKHEVLQMAKIRIVRGLGGLALVAWNYEQVMEYINENM